MALRATVARLATSQGLSAPAGAPVFSASLPEAKARSRQFFREVRTRPRDPNPVARATAGSDPNPTLGLLFRARFEEKLFRSDVRSFRHLPRDASIERRVHPTETTKSSLSSLFLLSKIAACPNGVPTSFASKAS
jgi:hypothetical protein